MNKKVVTSLARYIAATVLLLSLFGAPSASGQCPEKKHVWQKALCSIPVPGRAPTPGRVKITGHEAAKRAVEIAVGEVLGDGLPIRLDETGILPPVQPPVDFQPTEISCAADNIVPLKPGDYTCKVLLYCMKDGDHWPAPHAPYGLSPLQGRLAEPIATLLNRGSAAGVDPVLLQAISWSIQASVPLSQMPAPFQEVIYRLLPEPDLIESLRGDFLERITAAYVPFQFVPGTPSLDVLLGEMGEPGKIIQDIRRSHQILKEETLNFERQNFERLSQRLGPPGPQVLLLPALTPASQWSQIRPGVIAQLVVTTGNLRLNQLNFRVLPNAASKSRSINPRFLNANYAQNNFSSGDVLTIAELFGAIAQPEAAPGLLGDMLRRRFGQALIGYALYGIRTQALVMAMPPGDSCGNGNPAQYKRLSDGDIKKLKANGIDPEQLKRETIGGTQTSRFDLFKDSKGNIYVMPKSGCGPGEPTGININSLD